MLTALVTYYINTVGHLMNMNGKEFNGGTSEDEVFRRLRRVSWNDAVKVYDEWWENSVHGWTAEEAAVVLAPIGWTYEEMVAEWQLRYVQDSPIDN